MECGSSGQIHPNKEGEMKKVWFVLGTLVLMVMLVALVPSALAGPVGQYQVRLENATIPWLFPPPDGLSSFCAEVPEGVHINPDDLGSNRHKNASQIDGRNGSRRIVISDLIKGTATDNSGNSYGFVYENNVTLDFDGSTVHARMKDTFSLKGGDVNYTTGFNWRWAYSAESIQVVEVVDNGQTVDLVVDFFPFATDDGVNESPNIIPGSWQKVSTRGDPFNCDPL
jgi:hypothetical protein